MGLEADIDFVLPEELKDEDWPRAFVCVPRVGDCLESRSGVIARVECVIHPWQEPLPPERHGECDPHGLPGVDEAAFGAASSASPWGMSQFPRCCRVVIVLEPSIADKSSGDYDKTEQAMYEMLRSLRLFGLVRSEAYTAVWSKLMEWHHVGFGNMNAAERAAIETLLEETREFVLQRARPEELL